MLQPNTIIYVLLCTNVISILFLIRILVYKNEIIENKNDNIVEKTQENEDLDILVSELEVELQNRKKEADILDGKLNEEIIKNEKLNTEIQDLKTTLREKMKEYDSRYVYLNNFLNNGIFYDKQNDTMVLISELIRVADLEDVEEKSEKTEENTID
jgi:peptidoglycan hydrolase CwlO-like protein